MIANRLSQSFEACEARVLEGEMLLQRAFLKIIALEEDKKIIRFPEQEIRLDDPFSTSRILEEYEW
jgi:hypothetical protein